MKGRSLFISCMLMMSLCVYDVIAMYVCTSSALAVVAVAQDPNRSAPYLNTGAKLPTFCSCVWGGGGGGGGGGMLVSTHNTQSCHYT